MHTGQGAVRFELGQVQTTRAALQVLNPLDLWDSLTRHRCGDWGDIPERDWALREIALAEKMSVLSRYTDREGRPFLVVTTFAHFHDYGMTILEKPSTTVLLPGETSEGLNDLEDFE
jgi:hypothetical protein